MCTAVILRRPGHPWPLIVAANRDEMAGRPWQPPGRHWAERPDVTAGLDEVAGGTWLGLNELGVVAGVLNRPGSLGPAPGLRSRGELPLEALAHADAETAAQALGMIEPKSYRTFNLFVADAQSAFWIASPIGGEGADADTGADAIEVTPVPEGVSMITAWDMNDVASPRIRHYLPKFRAATAPDPDGGDWAAWQALMAGHGRAIEGDPDGAMTFRTESGFGTVSSSLIALPAPPVDGAPPGLAPARKPVWLFAPGPPDTNEYRPIGD